MGGQGQSPFEKVTFKVRLAQRESASHMAMWKTAICTQGRACAKSLWQDKDDCPRHGGRLVWLKLSVQGEGSIACVAFRPGLKVHALFTKHWEPSTGFK